MTAAIDPDAVAIRNEETALISQSNSIATDVENAPSGWTKLYRNTQNGETLGAVSSAVVNDGVSFVSPVLKDDAGNDMYINGAFFWVIFSNDVDRSALINSLIPIQNVKKGSLVSYPNQYRPSLDGQNVSALDGNASGYIVYLVELNTTDGLDVLREVERLSADPVVAAVEPDLTFLCQTDVVAPNDPHWPVSWHLEQSSNFDLDALAAWDRTYGYSSVKVAVLDSAVDQSHVDLQLAGYLDFTSGDPTPTTQPSTLPAYESHGTAVAGTIKATVNNGLDVAGLAPTVSVYSYRIGYGYDQDGYFWSSARIGMNAYNWAAQSNVRVTNCSNSMGSWNTSALRSVLINTRNSNRMVHFASSGNKGTGSVGFPASADGVIAVGATTNSGTRADFSQYGSGLDLVMPGDGIFTTDVMGYGGYNLIGSFVSINGTSFSSPLAAASAALVLSKNQRLTPSEVETALYSTARDLGSIGRDDYYGHGQVRPALAMDAVSPSLFYAAGFVDVGDGHKYQAKYGTVLDDQYPIFKHYELGWQLVYQDTPSGFWTYDYRSGKNFFTSIDASGSYPWIWVQEDNAWLWYYEGTANPRWFYNSATGQDVSF